jgi:hypothetical protein
MLEEMSAVALREALLQAVVSSGPRKNSAQNEEMLRDRLTGLTVQLVRGFTCNQKMYMSFTKTVLNGMDVGADGDMGNTLNQNNHLHSNNRLSSINEGSSSSGSGSGSGGSGSGSVELVELVEWMNLLPITVTVTVEHGHGTKLLNTGVLR